MKTPAHFALLPPTLLSIPTAPFLHIRQCAGRFLLGFLPSLEMRGFFTHCPYFGLTNCLEKAGGYGTCAASGQ